METLPGRRRRVSRHQRPARARARSGRLAAVRGLLRGGPAGRLPAHRGRQRLPPGGLRSFRSQHLTRSTSERRPCLPASGGAAPEPGRSSVAAQANRILFEGRRAVGVEYTRRGVRRRGRSSGPSAARSSAAAGPSTHRSSSSCPGSATARSWRRSASTSSTTCRASVRTCRTTWRSTSSTRARSRCRCTRPCSGATARGSASAGCSCVAARGRRTTSRPAGFIRSNDDVAYPNVMFHFLPIAIRYDGSAPGGGHGYQVHVGPMYSDARGSVKITSTDPRAHPALRFNYLSTAQDRREWVEVVRKAREHPGPARVRRAGRGELSPGAAVETDEQILAWVARDAETALHPSCTCRMGTDDDVRAGPHQPAGARPRGAPRGRRLRHALRHQRQHLRAGHDAGREGGRPDHGEHAAAARARRLLPPSRGGRAIKPGRRSSSARSAAPAPRRRPPGPGHWPGPPARRRAGGSPSSWSTR